MRKLLIILSILMVISPLYALSVKSCKDAEQIVDHDYFVLGYDEDTECPLYVEYTLSEDETRELGSYPRKNHFREDKEVITGSADETDYSKSGYDRGHLFPAYQGSFSKEAMDMSFVMSNMCPQTGNLNRVIWKNYEESIVDIARKYGDVERVCGPIFDKDKPAKWIGRKNKIRVPDRFYSIISYKKNGKTIIECIIMTNEQRKDDIRVTSAKIETIEKLTGIEFYK